MAGPVNKIKVGKIELSQWQSNYGTNWSFRKNYFDKKENQWKESKTLFAEDLADLQEACKQAVAMCERDGTAKARPQSSARHAGPPEPQPPVEAQQMDLLGGDQPPPFTDEDIPF